MHSRAHSSPPPLHGAIEEALDVFRPRMRRDGTDVEVAALYDDGLLELRLSGHHACCPVAVATLQSAIEEELRARVPEVRRVVLVR